MGYLSALKPHVRVTIDVQVGRPGPHPGPYGPYVPPVPRHPGWQHVPPRPMPAPGFAHARPAPRQWAAPPQWGAPPQVAAPRVAGPRVAAPQVAMPQAAVPESTTVFQSHAKADAFFTPLTREEEKRQKDFALRASEFTAEMERDRRRIVGESWGGQPIPPPYQR